VQPESPDNSVEFLFEVSEQELQTRERTILKSTENIPEQQETLEPQEPNVQQETRVFLTPRSELSEDLQTANETWSDDSPVHQHEVPEIVPPIDKNLIDYGRPNPPNSPESAIVIIENEPDSPDSSIPCAQDQDNIDLATFFERAENATSGSDTVFDDGIIMEDDPLAEINRRLKTEIMAAHALIEQQREFLETNRLQLEELQLARTNFQAEANPTSEQPAIDSEEQPTQAQASQQVIEAVDHAVQTIQTAIDIQTSVTGLFQAADEIARQLLEVNERETETNEPMDIDQKMAIPETNLTIDEHQATDIPQTTSSTDSGEYAILEEPMEYKDHAPTEIKVKEDLYEVWIVPNVGEWVHTKSVKPAYFARRIDPDGAPCPIFSDHDPERAERAGTLLHEGVAQGFYTYIDGNRYAIFDWGEAWIPYDTIVRFICDDGKPYNPAEDDEWVKIQLNDVINIGTIPIILMISDLRKRCRAREEFRREHPKAVIKRPKPAHFNNLYWWEDEMSEQPNLVFRRLTRAGTLRHPGIAHGYIETDSGNRYAYYPWGPEWIPHDTVVRFLDEKCLPINPMHTPRWITQQRTDVIQLAPLVPDEAEPCDKKRRYAQKTDDEPPPPYSPSTRNKSKMTTKTPGETQQSSQNAQEKGETKLVPQAALRVAKSTPEQATRPKEITPPNTAQTIEAVNSLTKTVKRPPQDRSDTPRPKVLSTIETRSDKNEKEKKNYHIQEAQDPNESQPVSQYLGSDTIDTSGIISSRDTMQNEESQTQNRIDIDDQKQKIQNPPTQDGPISSIVIVNPIQSPTTSSFASVNNTFNILDENTELKTGNTGYRRVARDPYDTWILPKIGEYTHLKSVHPAYYNQRVDKDNEPYPRTGDIDPDRKKRAGKFLYFGTAEGYYVGYDGNKYAVYTWGEAWIPYDTIIRWIREDELPDDPQHTMKWVLRQENDVVGD